MAKGWSGFDLDGCLAYYDGWKGADHIGEPVPAMLTLLKTYLAVGHECRIFTARVYDDPDGTSATAIEQWCLEHVGQVLPITCMKDYQMVRLYDDRCSEVVPNKGLLVQHLSDWYIAKHGDDYADDLEAYQAFMAQTQEY